MHELGILRQIVRRVDRVARENKIQKIKHITLEVGERSGVVPIYLKKMYPVAVDAYPVMQQAELRINIVADKNLVIKEIGY